MGGGWGARVGGCGEGAWESGGGWDIFILTHSWVRPQILGGSSVPCMMPVPCINHFDAHLAGEAL